MKKITFSPIGLAHNCIVLTYKNGTQVSIAQNYAHEHSNRSVCGDYARTVEVLADGDDQPKLHLTVEELIEFLQSKSVAQ